MKATHAIVLLAVLALPCATPSPASGRLRAPTPEERTIFTRYRGVLHNILDKFADDNWREAENYRFDVADDVEVSDDPDVPLDINESMTREYHVRPNSDLYRRDFAPFLARLEAVKTDPNAVAALAREIKSSQLRVNVHFNRLNVSFDSAPTAASDIKIPGAAYACRTRSGEKGDKVVLLYGNWKAATWSAGNGWYHYHFRRSGLYPAIENIVIELDGSPDRINELLHTLDWNSINTALTQ